MIYHHKNLYFHVLNLDSIVHENGFFRVDPRPYAAFSYRMKGSGLFWIDGKQIPTKQGDIVFIPANMPYEVEYLSSEIIVVHFSKCNYNIAEKISYFDKELMRAHFLRMLNAWLKDHSVNQIKSYIYDIFTHCESDIMTAFTDTDTLRCVDYIHQHYTEADLSVEDICRKNYVSHSSLQRKFNQYLGMTPVKYIIKLCMNKALDMLSDRNISIKTIAYACGFNDEKYFSKIFKHTFGDSPLQIKRNLWY